MTVSAHVAPPLRGRLLYAKIAEVSLKVRSASGRAAALGLTTAQLKFASYQARNAGFLVADIDPEYPESQKFTELDRDMSGAACGRCGLRGPHICTADVISQLANARTSAPLPASPEDDIDSSGECLESLRVAAKRHRMDRRDLANMLLESGLAPRDSGHWRLPSRLIDEAIARKLKSGVPRKKRPSAARPKVRKAIDGSGRA